MPKSEDQKNFFYKYYVWLSTVNKINADLFDFMIFLGVDTERPTDNGSSYMVENTYYEGSDIAVGGAGEAIEMTENTYYESEHISPDNSNPATAGMVENVYYEGVQNL